MTEIQFDEPQFESRRPLMQKARLGLTGLVIRLGLANDEAGANKFQLALIIICVLVMLYIWWPSIMGMLAVPTVVVP